MRTVSWVVFALQGFTVQQVLWRRAAVPREPILPPRAIPMRHHAYRASRGICALTRVLRFRRSLARRGFTAQQVRLEVL